MNQKMKDIRTTIKSSPKPFLIAGPCSAETEEQVHQTVSELANNELVQLIRAGIWKPRTRPDSFEGVGEVGLQWLVDAGKEANLPVTTEVANAKHVDLALKAGIDVLWIGARTSVNPFAVQEIADALRGTGKSVMVKNPINPDLQLWIGAIERLYNADLTDIVAIHRGFSVYKHPKYRNIPNWEIPIALKEHLADIPIICDPSHITGDRNQIFSVSQKALDLNFDGLMIETHPNPDKAWSDVQQQVTPEQLKQITANFTLRSPLIPQEKLGMMEVMRDKIADVDDKIFSLLSQRMKIVNAIAEHKKEHNITILQHEHWKRIILHRLGQASELDLTPTFIRSLMDAIHQESIRHQTVVMNSENVKKVER